MISSQDLLLILILGTLANATNTELANNTNFLLLLLFLLTTRGEFFPRGCCNNYPNSTCCASNRVVF